jgi:hypothetical protein
MFLASVDRSPTLRCSEFCASPLPCRLTGADRPLLGVYVLVTEDEAPNPDYARLKLIADGDRFQLYKILNPETAASK